MFKRVIKVIFCWT